MVAIQKSTPVQRKNNMEVKQEETIDFNSLVSDAAVELNMSKQEVKVLAQQQKIKSKFKDGHYYVSVGEIQTYLTKLEQDDVEKEHTALDNVIDDIVKGVFNYSGNKEDLISQIARFMPKNKINTIHDRFGGSFSLGLNILSEKKVYNETDPNVFNVIKGLSQGTPQENLEKILAVEKEYGLEKMEFTLHGTTKEEISKEIKIINAPHVAKVKKLMKAYNENPDKPWEQFIMLVAHSFSSRISYDKKDNLNSRVCFPRHYFNPALQEKVLKFSEKLIALGDTVTFTNVDFADYDIDSLEEDDVVYLDPPYKNTDTDYVRSWSDNDETRLYAHLDELHSKGKKFALSNTFVHDGITNERLVEWAKDYKVYYLKKKYMQSEKSRSGEYETVEVLITNYGEGCNSPDVVAMYKEDTENIVQGSFFIDDEVERGNESHRLENIADSKFKASCEKALEHKCEVLVQRVNIGKSIIIFQEKYEIQKRLNRECGVKTQTYKSVIESVYNFDYETGRKAMNLALDQRIAKLKVEDIMKFKKKSLDTLHSMKVLTDEEFSLFLNGKHVLKSTRATAPSRKKKEVAEEVSESNQNQETTKSEDGSETPMPNQSDTEQTIAELKATIEKQNAVIEKQRAKIERYERLMIGSSMPKYPAQNNTFPRIEDAS